MQAGGDVEILTPVTIFSLPLGGEHGSVDEFEPGHRWQYAILTLDKSYDAPRRRFGFHPSLKVLHQKPGKSLMFWSTPVAMPSAPEQPCPQF